MSTRRRRPDTAVEIVFLRKRKRPSGSGLWPAYVLDVDDHGTWLFSPGRRSRRPASQSPRCLVVRLLEARRRTERWWLTVGCERPIGSTRSQAQASPSVMLATIENRRSRAGSASALNAVSELGRLGLGERGGGQGRAAHLERFDRTPTGSPTTNSG